MYEYSGIIGGTLQCFIASAPQIELMGFQILLGIICLQIAGIFVLKIYWSFLALVTIPYILYSLPNYPLPHVWPTSGDTSLYILLFISLFEFHICYVLTFFFLQSAFRMDCLLTFFFTFLSFCK